LVFSALLALAGHDTTRNTTSSGILALLHHPDAFGGGGRHFCFGSCLARLELTVVLGEVTRRLRSLHLAGNVSRITSSWTNALTSLPVTFDPAPKEAP
jgi:cytochrome P450